MRVFLANPPWRVGDKYGIRAGSRWPHFRPVGPRKKIPDYMPFPFFLAYTAAVMENEGIETMLVDSVAEGMNEEEFFSKVSDFKPDLYITETSTPSFLHDIDYTRRTHEILGGDVTIGLAGPHVSVVKGSILDEYPWIDLLLLGEYEYTALDVARAVENNSDFNDVEGIIYRDKSGRALENKRRELIADIDVIPWPARHFTPMLNYNDAFCGLPRPTLQMWASRGCPFNCIFCLWPQVMYGGSRYRARNPVDVVDEMEQTCAKYSMKSVYFDDDTFDIGKSRMLELAKVIKERNFNLPWGAMARADTIDSETLEALREAGLFAIKYGVESADPKILEMSGKQLDLVKLEETVAVTRALGIKFHLTFTFGLPGETWDTARKTVDFALNLNPDSVQFSIVTPFPGTKHYEMAKAKGQLITEDWSLYDGAEQAVIRTDQMSGEDIEEALRYALDRWASHNAVRNVVNNSGGRRWHYIKQGLIHPLRAASFIGNHIKYRSRKKKGPGG